MTVWTRIGIPAGPWGRKGSRWARLTLPGLRRTNPRTLLAVRGQRRVPSPP